MRRFKVLTAMGGGGRYDLQKHPARYDECNAAVFFYFSHWIVVTLYNVGHFVPLLAIDVMYFLLPCK